MQRLVVKQVCLPDGNCISSFFSHGFLELQEMAEVQTEKEIKIKGNLIYRNSIRCGDGLELRFATEFKLIKNVTVSNKLSSFSYRTFDMEDGFFHLAPNSIE